MEYDYLVVGAGLFGSVVAERIANDLNSKVLIIDRRNHIGGNCYSSIDEETGIEFHNYGTHIFHTSSKKVWDYIGQFAEFNNYHIRTMTTLKDKVYPIPINLATINSFYNLTLKPYEAEEFLKREIEKEGIKEPKNLEEKAVSMVGRPLYEAFIKGYTKKQWEKDPKDLPAEIISRLPMRYNYNGDYHLNIRWQGVPLKGYAKVFERLLKSPNIRLELNCDYFAFRENMKVRHKIIYTGPIDQYFDYIYGELEWRTVEFKKDVVAVEDYQGTPVMFYADSDVPYTRIHEPRHLHPERSYTTKKTVIFYETSKFDPSSPYYPINNDRNHGLCQKYKKLAEKEKSVMIGGRLGDYAYYDMDTTILAALDFYEEKIAKC
jgi:UDP-galactopyranose mutase